MLFNCLRIYSISGGQVRMAPMHYLSELPRNQFEYPSRTTIGMQPNNQHAADELSIIIFNLGCTHV